MTRSYQKFLVFLWPIALLVLDYSRLVGICDNCFGSWFMHFSGGTSVALMVIYGISYWDFGSAVRDQKLLTASLVLGLTALAGIVWEFYEFLLDNVFMGFLNHLAQPGLRDTMMDLGFDVLGALSILIIYWISKRYRALFLSK